MKLLFWWNYYSDEIAEIRTPSALRHTQTVTTHSSLICQKKLFINVPFLIGIFLWVRVYGWSRCLISDWCTLIRSSHTATCWYNFCKLSRTSDPGVLSAVDVHIYGRLWSNLNLILFVSFVLFALARHCYSNFLFNLLFHHTLLKSPQPRLSHVHHLFRIRTTSVVGIVNPLSVVRLRQLQSSDRGKKAVENRNDWVVRGMNRECSLYYKSCEFAKWVRQSSAIFVQFFGSPFCCLVGVVLLWPKRGAW